VATERLYYTDPTLLEFEGCVVHTYREGEHARTVLDRSAFYPTSGGQLCDTGSLAGVAVIDVVEAESGDVIHVTAEEPGGIGATVRGLIDQSRRWRNRQMHTAQHILSQTFIRLWGLETVSVHLGEGYGAVELNSAEIGSSQIEQAEQYAGEIVAANLPVDSRFVSAEEAAGLPLRKVPERAGTIRVIQIGEFDWSACGGTHCLRTAEVGVLKIIGVDKMHGRVLVRFLSGVQAIADYSQRFHTTDTLSRTLSCGISDLAPRIDKLQAENKELRKQAVDLLKELTPVRADALALRAERSGKVPVLIDVYSDADSAAQLAAGVAGRIHGLAVIVTGGKALIAVSDDAGLHAGNIAKEFASRAGLRGGGGPKAAQVGGADPSRLDEYRLLFMEIVAHA
jgi:alanyl-tRNA synthetase